MSPAVTPTKKIPLSSDEEQPSQLTRQKAGLELEKSELCVSLSNITAIVRQVYGIATFVYMALLGRCVSLI